jgi:LmbE family N-acetylglucosaminyl deacetylase
MRRLTFESAPDQRLNVLAIGAHVDDIEIGCGGTILRLAAEDRIATVRWVVMSATGPREVEARRSADAFLAGVPHSDVVTDTLRDGHFPGAWDEAKDRFEALAREASPDVVLTHRSDDAHQDHRLVGELTWTAFRDHLVLEYEIPKYDGDLGRPNLFVDLPEAVAAHKIDLLMELFPSQRDRPWFTPATFRATLRLRGVESRSTTGLAEAFHARKLVV